jgi:glycosyltransferase involved in cell wall biosynthesis
MNIFIFLQHFPPLEDNFPNGTTKSVHGLATGLVAAGARVEILAEAQTSSYRHSRFGYAVRTFAAPPSRNRFRVSDELLQFVGKITSSDLLLLNGIFSPNLVTIARAIGTNGARYIVVPHDPYNPAQFRKSAWLKHPYWHLYEKSLLRHALAVQILDRRHADFLVSRGVRTPTIEVPNGFEPSDIDDFVREPCGAARDGLTHFYFLGRIDSFNKGLDILIKAFARFCQGRAVDLTLQGPDQGDAAALMRLSRRLGVLDRVRILPPNYDRRGTELIAAHDLFCLPSRYEGFGFSALEAMLAERALLVSDVAGIAPYVIQSNAGLIVEPTREAIFRGLELAWERRREWPSMGARGREHVLKTLTWETIGRRALAEYQRLFSDA